MRDFAFIWTQRQLGTTISQNDGNFLQKFYVRSGL
jgi:hypothetical protein